MKKPLIAIVLGIVTSATAAGALAQTPGWGYGPGYQQPSAAYGQPQAPGSGPGAGFGPGMGQGMGPDPAQRIERRLDHMTARLALSEQQQTQIRTILQEQHAKRMGMRGETFERIAGVLDEQQRAQLEQMRGQRMGRGGGMGPGAGPGAGYGRGGYGPGYGYGRGGATQPQY